MAQRERIFSIVVCLAKWSWRVGIGGTEPPQLVAVLWLKAKPHVTAETSANMALGYTLSSPSLGTTISFSARRCVTATHLSCINPGPQTTRDPDGRDNDTVGIIKSNTVGRLLVDAVCPQDQPLRRVCEMCVLTSHRFVLKQVLT